MLPAMPSTQILNPWLVNRVAFRDMASMPTVLRNSARHIIDTHVGA